MAGVAEDDSSNTTLEFNANPLLNPYILATIFNYMKPDDLKTCRQICKIWNEEATRVLSIKSAFRNINCQTSITILKTISDFHDLFETSIHPEWLLKNVELNVDLFTPCKTLTLSPFIQDYGKYFMSLKFTESIKPFRYSYSVPKALPKIQDLLLYKVLHVWCPNMLHLQIWNHQALIDHKDEVMPMVNTTSSLKIQSFAIAEIRPLPTFLRRWLSSVLNGCRNLKSLEVCRNNEYYDSESIFENLLEYPNIARRLEILTTTLLKNDFQLKFLSEMCNLKKLKLKTAFLCLVKEFPISCFSKIKTCLNHLELRNVCFADKGNTGVLAFAAEFPNLEFFKINLIIVFGGVNIKTFSTRLEILRRNPHKSLKKLLLLNNYNEIWDAEGISALIEAFPSLEFLHIDFGYRSGDWNINRAKLSVVFSILSKLKFLKELVIGTYVEDKTELISAISFTRDFKELQCLTIGLMKRRHCEEWAQNQNFLYDQKYCKFKTASKIKYQWRELGLQQNLSKVQNLRYVRLIDFKISNPKKQDVNFMKKNNIKLSFIPWEALQMERPTWYSKLDFNIYD